MDIDKMRDLSYINKDNYIEILKRINFVLDNHKYKINNTSTPKDLIDLIYLKNEIIRRFDSSYNFKYCSLPN